MMPSSIFRNLLKGRGWDRWDLDDNDTAMICAIKNVSCPYCGGTYPILTLGSLRPRVDKRMYQDGGLGPNPGFKYTHLANPIECPLCKKRYVTFVGIEHGRSYTDIKGVHVKIARLDESFVKENSRWPHSGLVANDVIEYNPPARVFVYSSIDHYLSYNEDSREIKVSSLTSIPVESYSEGGDGDVKPPEVIDLDDVKRPTPPPKYNYI